MKNRCLVLTALSVLSAGGLVQAQTTGNVATIEAAGSGTVVLNSSPVITAIMSQPGTVSPVGYTAKTFTSYAILAQDSSGSVDVFGALPSGNTYVPTVGDAIGVSGTFSAFHQIPEVATITAISQVSSGNSVPAPLNLTIPQLSVTTLPQGIEGYLVELDNVTISGGTIFTTANQALTVTDSSNNSMTLYDWPTSYSVDYSWAGQTIPTGPVNILALDSVFPGASPLAELVPYSITPAPEPASIALAAIGGVSVLMGLRRRK